MVTINGIALRQELTPDPLQSLVNTIARMLGWGGYPLGALVGGGIAGVLAIRVTLLVMCAPVAAAALLGLRSPLSRPPLPPPVSGGPTAGLPGRSHGRPRAQYPAPGSRASTRRTCRCGALAASR
jgi:hypothetical protein